MIHAHESIPNRRGATTCPGINDAQNPLTPLRHKLAICSFFSRVSSWFKDYVFSHSWQHLCLFVTLFSLMNSQASFVALFCLQPVLCSLIYAHRVMNERAVSTSPGLLFTPANEGTKWCKRCKRCINSSLNWSWTAKWKAVCVWKSKWANLLIRNF